MSRQTPAQQAPAGWEHDSHSVEAVHHTVAAGPCGRLPASGDMPAVPVQVKWREDAVAGIDGTARSLLLFQGAASVQGLFDHLLGDVMGEQAAALDVPTLLAPVPFPGASLQHLLPQVASQAPLPPCEAVGAPWPISAPPEAGQGRTGDDAGHAQCQAGSAPSAGCCQPGCGSMACMHTSQPAMGPVR